jgi:MoaA/NifB/PqqE/SkfB family radical SAM enzyme
MKKNEVVQAWGKIIRGQKPSLSVEITKECPLRCSGCYAFAEGHVGDGVNLRQLSDRKGNALIEGVLDLVDRYHPLHLSIVGGDPMVRFRELEVLLPALSGRGIFVQLVTSAFREIPRKWAEIPRLGIVVSVDGLQPEHDARRKPATYDRIIKNIVGHRVTLHCTITAQMMRRSNYLDQFLSFWTWKKEVGKVWMSMLTPQRGEQSEEILSPAQRRECITELKRLRAVYPKLDMFEAQIEEFGAPPSSPKECIFAQTTRVISADLTTEVTPCQLGGNPDGSQCGCVASMGLAAVGHHQLAFGVTTGKIFRLSSKMGDVVHAISRFRKAS